MEYLHDEKGKKIKDNSLFDNIYDYSSACNNDGNKAGNNWHGQKMSLLEQTIRKKHKELPLINIVFKKIKEKDIFVNPEIYLQGNHEKYFELLKEWKSVSQDKYLKTFPQTYQEFLRLGPYRHKKNFS